MKYVRLNNYRVIATCSIKTPEHTQEAPDTALLHDYLIDGVLYPASEYTNKIPTVKDGKIIWRDDMTTLRAAKLAEIYAAYLAERTTANKGITSEALGNVIDCRESDVLNISNLVTFLESRGTTEYFYKLKDNTEVDCTVAQIKTVLTELITALLSMWQLKQTLTEQINAATTAEEIRAITWQWPID